MAKTSGKIFISYRRSDSSAWAGRLYDRLCTRFPPAHIFLDVDLEPGFDFAKAIEESVGSCDVLVAIIGRRWLSSADDHGKRRLDNPEDIVRLEIAAALKHGIRVIPILVDGALLPRSLDLPDDLKQLVERKALELNHPRFNADSERLIRILTAILKRLPVEFESADTVESNEYESSLSLGYRPLNEAKIIIIGHGGVGKTSIVKRLVDNSFSKDQPITEGISITRWNLPLSGSENVKLNVWDFGGQEIMHGTHQFFLTDRTLYVLVLAGERTHREGHEDQDAEYWLKLIHSFGGTSPILVVLNKADEVPIDVNRQLLCEKYPTIRGFIVTDCETKRGITQLSEEIAAAIDRLDDVRLSFPHHWFNIKEKLATGGLNFLRYEEFRKLCSQMGERDEAEQDSLARSLNTLGIALNFRTDPRLRDHSVLNPEWVTGAVYAIINSRELAQAGGELRFSTLASIWPRAAYPEEMYGFLLDLMRKFELCFPLDEASQTFLVPALLNKQEPGVVREFVATDALCFEYRYGPVLPEGLLPRFVVRTYVHSRQGERWRTGLLLHFEGNRALLRADREERRVEIRVDGPYDGRRRLLAIARAHFEELHTQFGNLNPQALVPIDENPGEWIPYQELLVYEAAGEEAFKKVIGGALKSFSVSRHLGLVDLEGQRIKEPDQAERVTDSRRVKRSEISAFISYSHAGERFRAELETHLTLLQRQALLDVWNDRRIEVGQEWNKRIHDRLNTAQLIILLVSSDFLASKYCYEQEMKIALKRNAKGSSVLLWIPVRDCDVTGAPFGHLQAATRGARSISKERNRDKAWTEVSQKIREVCESLKRIYNPSNGPD